MLTPGNMSKLPGGFYFSCVHPFWTATNSSAPESDRSVQHTDKLAFIKSSHFPGPTV